MHVDAASAAAFVGREDVEIAMMHLIRMEQHYHQPSVDPETTRLFEIGST